MSPIIFWFVVFSLVLSIFNTIFFFYFATKYNNYIKSQKEYNIVLYDFMRDASDFSYKTQEQFNEIFKYYMEDGITFEPDFEITKKETLN